MEKHSLQIDADQKPYVFNYVSATKFLTDYYNYRKKHDARFSYEIWSVEVKFKSRSAVRMICQGKRIVSEDFVEIFSLNEKFSEEEKDYFMLLAHYQSTKSKSLKEACFCKIAERTRALGNSKEVKERLRFLSNSMLPTLHVIISFKDFKATEIHLKEILNIDLSTLRKHIQILEEIGMIQCQQTETEKEKIWISCAKYFKVSDQKNDEAIKFYQKENLAEAIRTIDTLDESLTRFRTVLFSVDDSKFIELVDDIENFFSKIKFKYANDFIQNKKLYKVNLQTYPVTE